jgi:putative DNA-invertase from lambdoid prophage Rac
VGRNRLCNSGAKVKAAIYLRVSTEKQSEENQEPDCLRLCKARGWKPVLYRETMSGAKKRPVWDAVKEDVRLGKVAAVVVWALDRTGRNRVQIAHDLGELFRFGAVVASVKDSWLDQATGPLRDLLVQILGWVAEGERARLIERTNAGLDRARAQGRKLGRKPIPELTQTSLRFSWKHGLGANATARALGLPESTVRTYFRRFEEPQGGAKKGPKRAA